MAKNSTIGRVPYSLALRLSTPGDKTSEKKIYGTIQQRETIDLKKLANHIHEHGSSFSVGTLQGVLSDMVDCTCELLKQGYSVNFEGLMRLYITANSKGVDDAEVFDPSVHFTHINMRCDVDADVDNYLNNSPEFEYVMTREEQSAAKKSAKAALIVGGSGSTDSSGTDTGSGTGGSNTGGTGGNTGGTTPGNTGGGTTPGGDDNPDGIE